MHYTEILDKIIEKELRTDFGKTPGASVLVNIGEGKNKKYRRVSRGVYELIDGFARVKKTVAESVEVDDKTSEVISSFGMYWNREQVDWEKSPTLLGKERNLSDPIDFSEQSGVYVLYDVHRPVYVGRATSNNMAKRLQDHTTDRLKGRWDRFSWFGILPVQESVKLHKQGIVGLDTDVFVSALEALLIEALEPSQNRKKGEYFGVEYIQDEDPSLKKRKEKKSMDTLLKKLNSS